MIKKLLLFFLTLTFLIGESKIIFSNSKHNGFTDIYNNRGDLYVIFRSASSHEYELDSEILIYKLPKNTTEWKKFMVIKDNNNNNDLRDPFFLPSKNHDTMQVYIRIKNLNQDLHFTRLYTINLLSKGFTYKKIDNTVSGWPWKIRDLRAWKVKYNNRNKYYYTISFGTDVYDKRFASLYKSRDGINNFEEVKRFDLNKFDCALPTEADIAFKKNSIYALLRCNGRNSLIGQAPLNNIKNWKFKSTGKQLHSPSFLEIEEKIYVAFRDLSNKYFGIIGLSTLHDLEMKNNYRILYKDKSHKHWDIGYPGMTMLDGEFYISYYISKFDSSKEIINSSIIVTNISKQRKSIIHFPIF